ncbi:MAG: hypothetical protein Q7S27_03300 [Nanoarchaeota archaeon]|nr:hypothetical protein [Nanoarchaeota archaeon]
MAEVIGAVIMGILIAIIDTIFMIKDESADAKTVLGHGLGSLVYLIPFCLAAFNLDFVIGMDFIPEAAKNKGIILAGLGVITAIIIHAKSAMFKHSKGLGTHITWAHSLVVGILVAVSPFVYVFISPFVEGLTKKS